MAPCGASPFEFNEPVLQSLLAKAPVAAELDMRDATRPACAHTQSFVTPRRSATSSAVNRRVMTVRPPRDGLPQSSRASGSLRNWYPIGIQSPL
jgi:hypothetical protein